MEYLPDFDGAQIEEFTLRDVIYHNVLTQMADVSLETVVDRLRSAHAHLDELRASRAELAAAARAKWDFRAVMSEPLLARVSALMRGVGRSVSSASGTASSPRDEPATLGARDVVAPTT
jgi:hypothetical protein